MRTKKLFSVLLAAAMVFGLLCAPASAADSKEAVDALAQGGLWLDQVEHGHREQDLSVKLLNLVWSENNTVITKQTTPESVVFSGTIDYLSKGITITVGPNFALDTVFAYSDPDGDGVYEERLFRSVLKDDEWTPEVVPLSEKGPFKGSDTAYYTNYCEWGRGANYLAQEGIRTGYRILTTDFLLSVFGANTILELSDGTGEYAKYLVLTDEERDASLGDDKLENYGISATISGHLTSTWAKDVVVEAFLNHMVPAYMEEAHNYDLRGSVTRGEFAGIAVRLYEAMSGEEAFYTDDDPFVDVETGTDRYTFIMAARDLGIVKGTSTTARIFEPDKLVSRQEAALMLSRVFEAVGGEIPAGASTTFGDNGEISSWAMDAVAFMSARGIINGVGSNRFNPKGNATVEEALKIAVEMLKKLDV